MSEPTTELLDAFEGMYADDDSGYVRCYSRRIVVRTRKEHECPGNFSGALHPIPVGITAVMERAIFDGKWHTCYTCMDCVKKWNRGLLNDSGPLTAPSPAEAHQDSGAAQEGADG